MNPMKSVSTVILHQAATSGIPIEDRTLVSLKLALPTAVFHGINKMEGVVPEERKLEFAEILGNIFTNGLLAWREVEDEKEKEN